MQTEESLKRRIIPPTGLLHGPHDDCSGLFWRNCFQSNYIALHGCHCMRPWQLLRHHVGKKSLGNGETHSCMVWQPACRPSLHMLGKPMSQSKTTRHMGMVLLVLHKSASWHDHTAKRLSWSTCASITRPICDIAIVMLQQVLSIASLHHAKTSGIDCYGSAIHECWRDRVIIHTQQHPIQLLCQLLNCSDSGIRCDGRTADVANSCTSISTFPGDSGGWTYLANGIESSIIEGYGRRLD